MLDAHGFTVEFAALRRKSGAGNALISVSLYKKGGIFMLTKDELPACPVATTLMLIGNKWKIFIVQRLLDRPWRFNELQKDIPGISQRVLTDNLRSMESDGIITRTIYPEVPVRVEYALSELGDTMRPIISSLFDWGIMYQSYCAKINFSSQK